MTLNSSFSTAWYPGENVNDCCNVRLSYMRATFSDLTVARQIEGALVSAPLILQEDFVNAGIILGDLEFGTKGRPYCQVRQERFAGTGQTVKRPRYGK